jgi:hypothetical protein
MGDYATRKKRKVFISRKLMLTDKENDGEYNPNTREIVINPDRSIEASIATYIHENLHYLMPKKSERSIRTLEKYIVKELSVKEKQILFRLMAAEGEFDD